MAAQGPVPVPISPPLRHLAIHSPAPPTPATLCARGALCLGHPPGPSPAEDSQLAPAHIPRPTPCWARSPGVRRQHPDLRPTPSATTCGPRCGPRPRRPLPFPSCAARCHLLRLSLLLLRPLPRTRRRRRRAPRTHHASRPTRTATSGSDLVAWARGRGPRGQRARLACPARSDWWREEKRGCAGARRPGRSLGPESRAGPASARRLDAEGWCRRERARRKMAAAMLGPGTVCAQRAATARPVPQTRRRR